MQHLQPISRGNNFSYSHHILKQAFNQHFFSGTHHGTESRVGPTQRESTAQRFGFLLASTTRCNFHCVISSQGQRESWHFLLVCQQLAFLLPFSTYNLLLFVMEFVPMPEVLSAKGVNGDSKDFYVRASAVAFKRRWHNKDDIIPCEYDFAPCN